MARERTRAFSIEEIQDLVENGLIDRNAYGVAKAYIKWRYKREIARNAHSEFMKAVGQKLAAKNVENQNANLDERSFSGRMGEAQRLLTKEYALC
jgi:ribonucleoside-triphosphate reductase